MPFVGLGLHILIALYFAVHALRNGRQMYWLIILFSFPLLGSVVYFFAEYLPEAKLNRGVQKVSKTAIKILDPNRELREAQQAFELTPTVQNRIRLAAALDEAGQYKEAVVQFDACLSGPFANESELRFLAAKAKLDNQQPNEAVQLLTSIRAQQPDFRAEQLSLLLAKSYAANQNQAAAKQEFAHAAQTFSSVETQLAYAMWAVSQGDLITAQRLRESLASTWSHWNKHSRSLHKDSFNALDVAIANAQK